MSRFIKFIPSEKSQWLIKRNHCAFILLCVIASRARRISGHIDRLEIGEAKIGDWNSLGMTRQQYRTALNILCDLNFVKIQETNRTRKKSTTASTTEGTLVKLINSDIWDINIEDSNHCINHRATTDQPLTNHEQERIRKNKKEKEEDTYCSDSRTSRGPSIKDSLIFCFEEKKFIGYGNSDVETWKTAYPGIDLSQTIASAEQWILSQPIRGKKKLWRRFLTSWMQRASEKALNKSASSYQQSNAKKNPMEENRVLAMQTHKNYFSHDCEMQINGKEIIFIPQIGQQGPTSLSFFNESFHDELKIKLDKYRFRKSCV